MDHRVISFVAGLRAGAAGLVTGALLGPAFGAGVAGLLMGVSATKSENGYLHRRREFSTPAGLTGLFAAVAIAGASAWSVLDKEAENPLPVTPVAQAALLAPRP